MITIAEDTPEVASTVVWEDDWATHPTAARDMRRGALGAIDQALADEWSGVASERLLVVRDNVSPLGLQIKRGLTSAVADWELEHKCEIEDLKVTCETGHSGRETRVRGELADGSPVELSVRSAFAAGLARALQNPGPTTAQAIWEASSPVDVAALSDRHTPSRINTRHAGDIGSPEEKDRSKEMNEKSYPMTVNRAFIKRDRETGEPVITDRVSKAGKPYQTCQVTIPSGCKTVQDGKVVDLSGYQATMFVNKNVTDPEKRDVTFYLKAGQKLNLFKTDFDTGERSSVTVGAAELAHAVAQERKEYQAQHPHTPEKEERADDGRRNPPLVEQKAAVEWVGGQRDEETLTCDQVVADYGAVQLEDEDIPF